MRRIKSTSWWALHGAELGEFLFPVAQHVRFDAAQVGDFADAEVAFGGDGFDRVGAGSRGVFVLGGVFGFVFSGVHGSGSVGAAIPLPGWGETACLSFWLA